MHSVAAFDTDMLPNTLEIIQIHFQMLKNEREQNALAVLWIFFLMFGTLALGIESPQRDHLRME